MKQEHDYSGALESMPKEDVHERVIWRWFLKHYSEIRAALTAAKGDGWLPIESAPKDGTHLQFWMNGECWYGKWFVNETYPMLSRWKVFGCKTWLLQPTHWRPLPKPPQDGGDDG